ncbi:MerR family transcriptional regulator [Dehalogenimonas sp. THU2]|uniref:helix-turn-helix domain-containing protein n=1 Tax=Dehalogenimonas sp. THU2 TaxID=3151121 RepID=UPI003218BF3A
MTDMLNPLFQVSEVARRAGVSIRTVRFYEEKGLLEAPDRTSGGMRLYDSRDISRIKLIRRLRNVGLDLDEIKGTLSDRESNHRERVEHTIEVLKLEAELSRRRIAELQQEDRERESLILMISQCLKCDANPCPAKCPPQQYVI